MGYTSLISIPLFYDWTPVAGVFTVWKVKVNKKEYAASSLRETNTVAYIMNDITDVVTHLRYLEGARLQAILTLTNSQ